jgi:sterol desaturase/sphingolipid hydroxylase (fatty acid hydroxylase superfamily)
MPENFNLPDISSYAAPIYIAFILLELFLINAHKIRGDYEARDAATSITMGLGYFIFGTIIASGIYAFLYGILFWVYQFRLIDIPFTIWALALCFILDDLLFYWSHRLQHIIRWGWASHVIHHSSQHYNLSTALRQPWFNFLTGSFILAIPLVLLGFHPAWIAFSSSLNLFYQFFVHTEAVRKMPPWFEAVFNTPSHHRVHHGRNPRYLDANYAGVLIVWDRLFGTFVPEEESETVRYGLVKNIGTFNPIKVATHEYLSIFRDAARPGLSFMQRLAYIFAPPGWRHDGRNMTSREIKEDFVADHPELAGAPGLPPEIPQSQQKPSTEPAE